MDVLLLHVRADLTTFPFLSLQDLSLFLDAVTGPVPSMANHPRVANAARAVWFTASASGAEARLRLIIMYGIT